VFFFAVETGIEFAQLFNDGIDLLLGRKRGDVLGPLIEALRPKGEPCLVVGRLFVCGR
jgi:hypothetical protein